MYSAPNEKSDVASQAIIGSNVVTREIRREWVRIRTDDEYSGWMERSALREFGTFGPYGSHGPTVRIEALFANVYQNPDIRAHKPLLTVPFGSLLELAPGGQGLRPRWLRARLPDQRRVWIHRGDANRDPVPLTIPQSIELAKRFLGVTYLWGGRSSYGYDCSGYTQMLVRSRGITMPRDTRLQAEWDGAEDVDRKRLIPGDLLFFGASRAEVNHTALYIGGGKMIHSSTQNRPGVQISRLDDRPIGRRLIACRRVR